VTFRIVRFFTALLSLFGLFVGVSALLTGGLGVRSALLSIIGLLLPILFIINLFLFIFWLTVKSRWAIIPALTLLASLPFLGSVLRFSSTANTSLEPTFTLCSYNAQGFNYGETKLTLELFAEFLQKNSIEILCLQEVDEQTSTLADSLFERNARLRYHVTLPGRQPGFALAVYSAYPLIRASNIPFPGTNNHALMVDVVCERDTIRIFNLHLQTTHFNQKKFKLSGERWMWDSQEETRKTLSLVQQLTKNTHKRQEQVDTLTTLIEHSPYRVIACGDLNSIPASYTYWKLRQTLKDGFRTAGKGYEYTYRYFGNLFRVDYIFHRSDLTGTSYRSYNLDYSDHKPVVINISLNK